MAERYKPYINIGPGDIIRDELEALDWTKEDLARAMGITTKEVKNIIANKTAVTDDTARLLSRALGPSAQFWMNADAAYRLRLKSNQEKEKKSETKILVQKPGMAILEG
jgi:addiction module HigA family antidote